MKNPKAWLSHRMDPRKGYKVMTDMLLLTRRFDLAAARRSSPSFEKLCREVRRLLNER